MSATNVIDAGQRGGKRMGRPSAGHLLEHRATGHLDPGLFKLLSTDRAARARAISYLLKRFWPLTIHDDLKNRLALGELDVTPGRAPDQRTMRSPLFSIEVLRAYEQACAFCGFQAFFQKLSFGLDAAHVRWHTEEGPDTVDNGLALCKLHHWAFDRGALGLTAGYRVQVSEDLVRTQELGSTLLELSGKPLRMPLKGHPAPAEAHVQWHQKHVFRGPARAF